MCALPTYDTPTLPMLNNDYIDIDIGIIIVIVRIIPTNPKPLCNIYAFTFILENKD